LIIESSIPYITIHKNLNRFEKMTNTIKNDLMITYTAEDYEITVMNNFKLQTDILFLIDLNQYLETQ